MDKLWQKFFFSLKMDGSAIRIFFYHQFLLRISILGHLINDNKIVKHFKHTLKLSLITVSIDIFTIFTIIFFTCDLLLQKISVLARSVFVSLNYLLLSIDIL